MIYVFVYLIAIVLANLLTAAFGPAISIFNAFAFIGLNLASRDALHDLWGAKVWRNMLLLIAAGGVISYVFNAGAGKIALASVVAFALSEFGDALVYHRMKASPYLTRANSSNVVGALIDSVVFPVIAFGGFLLPIILGQFAAKVVGGALWSYVLHKRVSHFEGREA